MDIVTYSEARKNLKTVMDRVVDDCDHTIITRQNGGAVVMLALSDWNSMMETAHLLSSPRNAERLRAAVARMSAGEGEVRQLIDVD